MRASVTAAIVRIRRTTFLYTSVVPTVFYLLAHTNYEPAFRSQVRHQFQTGVSFGDGETLRGFVFSCRQCHLENYTAALYVILNERRLIRTRFKDSISAVRKMSTVFTFTRRKPDTVNRSKVLASSARHKRTRFQGIGEKTRKNSSLVRDRSNITARLKRKNVNVSRDKTRRKS